MWCPETESNCRHGDFQSPALPTELSGRSRLTRKARIKPADAPGVKVSPLLGGGHVPFGLIVVFSGEKFIHFQLQIFSRLGIYQA